MNENEQPQQLSREEVIDKQIDQLFHVAHLEKINLKHPRKIREDDEDFNSYDVNNKFVTLCKDEKGNVYKEVRIGVDDSTIRTYKGLVKSVVSEIRERENIVELNEITDDMFKDLLQERIDLYNDGQLKEASNIKPILSAFNFFNNAMEKTDVFPKEEKCRIGDIKEIRAQLEEERVIRKTRASSNLRATHDQAATVIDNLKNQGHKGNQNRQEIAKLAQFSLYTGARVSDAIDLVAKDIRFSGDRAFVLFRDSKGELSRQVEEDIPERVKFLRELKEGKKPNQPVFARLKQDGTFKSKESFRKEVAKYVKDAGDHLTQTTHVRKKNADGSVSYIPVQQNFTHHSFRKAYTNERIAYYYHKFTTGGVDPKEYMKYRMNENKFIQERQGIKNMPDLEKKMRDLQNRINKNRTSGRRDLLLPEICVFFASTDIGHFRNSVVNEYYSDWNEAAETYNLPDLNHFKREAGIIK